MMWILVLSSHQIFPHNKPESWKEVRSKEDSITHAALKAMFRGWLLCVRASWGGGEKWQEGGRPDLPSNSDHLHSLQEWFTTQQSPQNSEEEWRVIAMWKVISSVKEYWSSCKEPLRIYNSTLSHRRKLLASSHPHFSGSTLGLVLLLKSRGQKKAIEVQVWFL